MARRATGTSAFSYAFPIIIALIIVVLFANFLFRDRTKTETEAPEKSVFTYVQPATDTSKISHTLKGRDLGVVSGPQEVYPEEIIEVTDGNGLLSFPDHDSKLRLNTGTRLQYLGLQSGQEVFSLENKEVWAVLSGGNVVIQVSGFEAYPSTDAVFNIAKNNLFSTVTVLQGGLKIQDDSGSVDLLGGQELVIQTLKSVAEVSEDVGAVSDDFQARSWFAINNGKQLLETTSSTDDTSTSTGSSSKSSAGILFESPLDETSVSTATVDVSGRIISTLVDRIIIDGKAATIGEEGNTFTLEGLSLPLSENDIVYKTYDENGDVLGKGILTVNRDGGRQVGGSSVAPSVTSLSPDDPNYKILAPSPNPYTTSENVVRIDGEVVPGTVDYITINDYRLSSFASKGKNWYYFANKQFGNLEDGTNLYIIRYYDEEGNEIHSQLLTIKKTVAVSTPEEEPVVETE